MKKRTTQNMIKNFSRLRTGDPELQKKIADVLADALPEVEPGEGYDEVNDMLNGLRYDYVRTDPQDADARMAILRDHADALFIDGLVYGAYLALGGDKE